MIELSEAPGYGYDNMTVYNLKTGKPLKPIMTGSGYPIVSPYVNGHYVNLSMHKIVAKYDLGVTGQVIEHINDDKSDYRPCNLKASTQSANITKALGIPIVGICISTGEKEYFASAAEASRKFNCEPSRITAICRRRKGYKTVAGYTFEYA